MENNTNYKSYYFYTCIEHNGSVYEFLRNNNTLAIKNGEDVVFDRTGGYDPAPAYKRHHDGCNPFDYYRFEIVCSKYWKHWGYAPIYYLEQIAYSKKDIMKMFELPFQCEKFIGSDKARTENELARVNMYAMVEKCLEDDNVPTDKKGDRLIPIPWLKPKEEWLEGELYR